MALALARPMAIAVALLLTVTACRASDETAGQATEPAETTTSSTDQPIGGESESTVSSAPLDQADGASQPPDPVVWTACGADLECGTVPVPLDHDVATGPMLDVSLIRVTASGPAIGSIFVNPGGPGASGVEFVRSGFRFDPETASRYHLVGFDPRGIGQSNPLDCQVDRTAEALPDLSPDTDQERAELDADAAAIALRCQEVDGLLLPHLTTEDVARDLDLLRHAVGDETLHYYGLSYGTLLGFRYAARFPDRVGHLVLDGVVNPAFDLTQLLLQQSRAFEEAFDMLDEGCRSGQVRCPADGVAAAYGRLVESLEQSGPQGNVGSTEVTMASLIALYSPDLWQPYASAMEAADDGNLGPLESLSDLFLGSISFTAYASFACADDGEKRDPADWDDLEIEAAAVAPRFGAVIANELRVCAHWPNAEAGPGPTAADQVDVPVLIIGTTGDAATPLANAEVMAELFPASHLVTVDGRRHTAYNGSTCVREVVARYFADDPAFVNVSDCSAD